MIQIEYSGRIRPVASPFMIGSSPSCDFVVIDQNLLPLHGILVEGVNGWLYVAYNGNTQNWINDSPINLHTKITNGDHLLLGQAEFIFHEGQKKQGNKSLLRPLTAIEGANQIIQALRNVNKSDLATVKEVLRVLAEVLKCPTVVIVSERTPLAFSSNSATSMQELSIEELIPLTSPCVVKKQSKHQTTEASLWLVVPVKILGKHSWIQVPYKGQVKSGDLQLATIAGLGLSARLSRPAKPQKAANDLDQTATWTR